jgi:hypothetical protein
MCIEKIASGSAQTLMTQNGLFWILNCSSFIVHWHIETSGADTLTDSLHLGSQLPTLWLQLGIRFPTPELNCLCSFFLFKKSLFITGVHSNRLPQTTIKESAALQLDPKADSDFYIYYVSLHNCLRVSNTSGCSTQVRCVAHSSFWS